MRRALCVCLVTLGLSGQTGTALKVHKVSAGHEYAAGLAWTGSSLLVSDRPAGKITKLDQEGASVFREGMYAGGLAVDNQNRLYVCDARERRVVRIDKKGKVDVLASEWDGKRLNSPAGIAVSRKGHVYFTDPAFASADDNRDLSFYGIYHLTPKGEINVIAEMETRPTGIALSPDGRRLYVADADNRAVLAWDLDGNGAASGRTVLMEKLDGVPNGIATSRDGRLCVAAGEVLIFSPDGERLEGIKVPERPSACAFGETDLFVAAGTSVFVIRPENGKGTSTN